ncbi:MAG TPA: FG-GAP and VCBS repeat-containing protein [Chthoniobacter sp.]|jgi:hypothetical protein
MKPFSLVLPLLTFFTVAAFAEPPVATGEFTRIQLTDQFWAEGAAIGDFNHDGKPDVVYGPYWWEGPDFKVRHTYRDDSTKTKVKKQDGTVIEVPGFKGALGYENGYSDDFLTYTFDFNGDGWTDILVIDTPGKSATWYENPKGAPGPWKAHVAFDVVDNESPVLTDLFGNGKPVLVCCSGGYVGYAQADWKHPEEKWTWHPISPKGTYQRYTHGIGVGDVNGDGRKDILEATGWWEQPASLSGDPVWKKHEFLFANPGKGGAQMYVYDVNGDGKPDIITSLEAHGYGLAWFEQTNDKGVEGWVKHLIVGETPAENPQGVHFSQPHALWLEDMNRDGGIGIITGKRFWAHGPAGDKEPNAPALLYWFELKRNAGKVEWLAHLIDDNSGVGTEVMAGDLNGDGKPDVLVGNKRGAFIFLRK